MVIMASDSNNSSNHKRTNIKGENNDDETTMSTNSNKRSSVSSSSSSSSTSGSTSLPLPLHSSPNTIQTCDRDVIETNEEVGYFFLNDAVITLVTSSANHSSRCSSLHKNTFIADKWMDVQIIDDDTTTTTTNHDNSGSKLGEMEHNEEVEEKKQDMVSEWDNDDEDHAENSSFLCTRCNLILYMNTEKIHQNNSNDNNMEKEDGMVQSQCTTCPANRNTAVTYQISKRSFYNGLVDDLASCYQCSSGKSCRKVNMSHHSRHNSSNNNVNEQQTKKQRSDAAILIGTLLQCRKDKFVRIESFRVLFSGSVETESESQLYVDDDNNNSKTDERNNTCINTEIDTEEWQEDGNDMEVENRKSLNNENTTNLENTTKQAWKTYQQVKCSIAFTISLPTLEKASQK